MAINGCDKKFSFQPLTDKKFISLSGKDLQESLMKWYVINLTLKHSFFAGNVCRYIDLSTHGFIDARVFQFLEYSRTHGHLDPRFVLSWHVSLLAHFCFGLFDFYRKLDRVIGCICLRVVWPKKVNHYQITGIKNRIKACHCDDISSSI